MTRNCTGGLRHSFLIRYPRVNGPTTVQACLARESAGRAQSFWICSGRALAPCPPRTYIDLSALARRGGSGDYGPVDARRAEPRVRSHAGPQRSHDRELVMARSTAAGAAHPRRASMADPPGGKALV